MEKISPKAIMISGRVGGLALTISSQVPRQVMRITCRGTWEEIVRATPPTLPEIRIALGEIFSIKPDPDIP